tara:strand:- start:303 stop:3476 length:3174 start_codon:yes stop_codon:yes gene_type:complete
MSLEKEIIFNNMTEEEKQQKILDDEYEYDLMIEFKDAQKSGDNLKELKAYKNLQNFHISQESVVDKAGVAVKNILPGLNKGFEQAMGLPVDLSNLILSFGEDGVRKILDMSGFNMEDVPKVIGNKPFGGSESVGKLFDKLNIKTDYQKNRALAHFSGRIFEEIGMTLPLMYFPLKGATPKNIAKIAGLETSLATAGGFGAAAGAEAMQAQGGFFQGGNSPIDLEAWGQALGYISPITTHAIYSKLDQALGLKTAAGLVGEKMGLFKGQSTASKVAANILFSKLDGDEISKLLFDLENKKLSKKEIFERYGITDNTIFGEAATETNFPRLLDEFFDSEQLTRLRQTLAGKEGGGDLASALEAYYLTRNHNLQSRFDKKMKLPENATTEELISFLNRSETDQLDFINSKLILAEQKVAEKLQLFENVNVQDATSFLKLELEDALDTLLLKEKDLWSKVGNKPNVNAIGDAAANIIVNNFKGADPSTIPQIFRTLAGENRLIDLGVIKGKTKKQTIGPKLGTRDVDVPGAAGILDNTKFAMDEVLNIKAQIHDLIRQTDGTTKTGQTKIDNLQSMLNTIDVSITGGVNAKNMDAASNALSFTNKIQSEVYDSNVGNILGYNPEKGKLQIIDANKFEELMSKGEAGGVQSNDFLKIIGKESEGAKNKIYSDINRMKDLDGNISRSTLKKYLDNNANLINELGLTKQFSDFDAVLAEVSTLTDDVARTKIEVGKHRKNVLLTNTDLNISNAQVTRNLFNEADKDKALNTWTQIKSILSEDDLAMNAFKNEVSDLMIDNISTVTKQGEKVLDLQKTIRFIDNNEQILKSIYGDNYSTIVYFQDTLKQIQPKVVKGTMTLDAIDKNNVLVSAIGRITGAKAGSMGFGPPLVLAGLGGRLANKIIGSKTEREVYEILSQAFIDKDFAAQLIKPLNDSIVDQIESNINRILLDNKAVFTTGTRLIDTQAEKLQKEIRPKISIEFEDGNVDETGTIQKKEVPVSGRTSINPASDRFANAIDPSRAAIAFGPNDMLAQPRPQPRPQQKTQFAAQGGIMNARKQIQRVA